MWVLARRMPSLTGQDIRFGLARHYDRRRGGCTRFEGDPGNYHTLRTGNLNVDLRNGVMRVSALCMEYGVWSMEYCAGNVSAGVLIYSGTVESAHRVANVEW
jgi:hypothetical protein